MRIDKSQVKYIYDLIHDFVNVLQQNYKINGILISMKT